MKVYMGFEFPQIADPDSDVANEIVDLLTAISAQQEDEFNALPSYKKFGKVSVWIDAVEGEA